MSFHPYFSIECREFCVVFSCVEEAIRFLRNPRRVVPGLCQLLIACLAAFLPPSSSPTRLSLSIHRAYTFLWRVPCLLALLFVCSAAIIYSLVRGAYQFFQIHWARLIGGDPSGCSASVPSEVFPSASHRLLSPPFPFCLLTFAPLCVFLGTGTVEEHTLKSPGPGRIAHVANIKSARSMLFPFFRAAPEYFIGNTRLQLVSFSTAASAQSLPSFSNCLQPTAYPGKRIRADSFRLWAGVLLRGRLYIGSESSERISGSLKYPASFLHVEASCQSKETQFVASVLVVSRPSPKFLVGRRGPDVCFGTLRTYTCCDSACKGFPDAETKVFVRASLLVPVKSSKGTPGDRVP